MTLALAVPVVRPLPVPQRRAAARATGTDPSDPVVRAERLAEAGLVTYLVGAATLLLITAGLFPGLPLLPGAVAASLLGPLAWIAWPAARGRRAAGASTVLVAMTAVAGAATVWGGADLIDATAYPILALAFLVAARPPWSFVGAGLAVIAPVPLCVAVGVTPPELIPIGLFGGLSLAPFVLLRLVAAVRALEDARAALAAQAVLVERLRIEDELRATVGAELAAIVELGRYAARPGHDVVEVERQLTRLVGASRRALAAARRTISVVRHGSLHSDLAAGASLLRAAGIDVRISVPPGMPAGPGDDLRAELRAATAQVLRSGDARSCALTVVAGPHGPVLDVVVNGAVVTSEMPGR